MPSVSLPTGSQTLQRSSEPLTREQIGAVFEIEIALESSCKARALT